jgi:hypothetical protein
MSEIRINARLDEEAASDLEFLKESTHANNTEVLKSALRFYAGHLRNEVLRSRQALMESGLIDSFEGPEDLSAYYKRYMAETIDEKYPPQESGNR